MSDKKIAEISESNNYSSKQNGFGLGLSYAKNIITNHEGLLRFKSTLEVGTLVEISLPAVNPPSWFLPHLPIRENHLFVILDDDASIHDLWEHKFSSISSSYKINFLHFQYPTSFYSWYANNHCDFHLFTDFYFSHYAENGIDVIRNIAPNFQKTLVTCHHEDHQVLDFCKNNKVTLLPKNLLSYIPIHLQ